MLLFCKTRPTPGDQRIKRLSQMLVFLTRCLRFKRLLGREPRTSLDTLLLKTDGSETSGGLESFIDREITATKFYAARSALGKAHQDRVVARGGANAEPSRSSARVVARQRG